jgi:acetylcholinesterase/cholinesterase
MFWIHGGDFKQGSGSGVLYNGIVQVNTSSTILVSINYRLAALGFMAGTDGIVGNYGIKDQTLALKWVQQNIAQFGGDPNQVTIYGQSAGSVSVSLHMMTEDEKGLFHGAIMQSNPMGLPLRPLSDWKNLMKVYAKKVKCYHTFKGVDEACLRALSTEAVLAGQKIIEGDITAELGHFLDLFMPMAPVVQSPSYPEFPHVPFLAFQSGQVKNLVPYIIGTVRDEALPFVWGTFGKPLGKLELRAVFTDIFCFSGDS